MLRNNNNNNNNNNNDNNSNTTTTTTTTTNNNNNNNNNSKNSWKKSLNLFILNPFFANVPILHSPRAPRNQMFLGVFRGMI